MVSGLKGVVRHPDTALKPPCRGAALPLLPWAFALLFAGVIRKSTVAIATAGSAARVASCHTRRDRVPSDRAAGLSTLSAAEAPPALAPRAVQTAQPSRGDALRCTASPFGRSCGQVSGAHTEPRCEFSLLMRFVHRIPVLAPLLSFPGGWAAVRRGKHRKLF